MEQTKVKPRKIDLDLKASARLLVRDIQRALKECDVPKAERLAREALKPRPMSAYCCEAGLREGERNGLLRAARIAMHKRCNACFNLNFDRPADHSKRLGCKFCGLLILAAGEMRAEAAKLRAVEKVKEER